MNNMPKGDLWVLVDDDSSSINYNKSFKFDFSYIKPEGIKALVKKYVWIRHEKRERTLGGLYNQMFCFKHFMRFAEARNIISLKNLANVDVENYKSYLLTTLSSRKEVPLSKYHQSKCFDILKAIIFFGQKEMQNEVPSNTIFSGNEYPGINNKLIIDFMPDSVVEQINKNLLNEKNIYMKCGIIILQATGMRRGDLLNLKLNCIGKHPIDGGPTLRYFIHKIRKNKTVKIPAKCAQAVRELIDYTSSIRYNAPEELKEFLFIYLFLKVGKIRVVTPDTFGHWLKKFIADNEIKNDDGKLYNLTSHHFRRTLFTDMLSKGLSYAAISKHGGVQPQNVSKFYADVKDKERGVVWQEINIVGNPDEIDGRLIPDIEELKLFNSNKDKGARMCDGYCTEPIKEGVICETLQKKHRCYSCRRYITTPEFLEYHKKHLEEIENELKSNIYGEHYASHLRPLAEILRQIIERLEEIK